MTLRPLNRWQRRGRSFGLALLILSLVQANGLDARTGDIIADDIPEVAELTTTQAAAREHLDRFFRLVLDDDGIAQMGAAVRVAPHA